MNCILVYRALAIAAVLALCVGGPLYANGTKPVVSIKGDAFNPTSILVQTGRTVTFTNDDDDLHTVTADDNSFDSNSIPIGKGFVHKFNKAGRYPYHCKIHPFMHGVVIVKAASP